MNQEERFEGGNLESPPQRHSNSLYTYKHEPFQVDKSHDSADDGLMFNPYQEIIDDRHAGEEYEFACFDENDSVYE